MVDANVLDFGAVGDGTTDDSAAINTAIASLPVAGGRLIFPEGHTFAAANGSVDPIGIVSGLEVTGGGVIKKVDASVFRAIFVGDSPAGATGYGSGLQDLHVHDIRFESDFSLGSCCPFALNNVTNILIEDVEFWQCQGGGGHIFDLGGCDQVQILRSTFTGQNTDSTSTVAEAVQIDGSYLGALTSGTAQTGCTGMLTRNVTVDSCEFLPLTVGATVYPGPTPMGAHLVREGQYYENITFSNNTVLDPIANPPESEANDGRGYYAGCLHFPIATRLRVTGNTITQTTGRSTRAINVMSKASGILATADPNSSSPAVGQWAQPLVPQDIVIADNTITGFTAPNGGNESSAIYVRGIDGAPMQNVQITGNTISDGYNVNATTHAPAISIRNAEHVTVTGSITNYAAGVWAQSVIDLTTTTDMVEVPAPITLLRVTSFRIGPLTARTSTVAPAVVQLADGSDNGTLYQVMYGGYQQLIAGRYVNVIIDGGQLPATQSNERRAVFTCWDKNFTRKGQIGKLISFDVLIAHNAPGSCTFTIDANNRRVPDLVADGARVTVDYYPGSTYQPIRYSGPVFNTHGEGQGEQATRTFTIVDDWSAVMNGILGYPSPDADDDHQLGTGNSGYYRSTGPAETVVADIVGKNATRTGSSLVVPASQGRGDTVTVQIRFHPLADRLFPVVDQAGIGVRVVQVGDHLELQMYEPTTYPRVLTEQSRVIQGNSFDLTAPTVTRPVVAGGGESIQRKIISYPNAALESELGRVLETFIDARDVSLYEDDGTTPNPNLAADMQARADEAFTDGARKESMDLTLVERGAFRFLIAFRLGDRVSAQMNQSPVITDIVRSVQISQQIGKAITVTPKVGDWTDNSTMRLYRMIQQWAKSVRDMKRS